MKDEIKKELMCQVEQVVYGMSDDEIQAVTRDHPTIDCQLTYLRTASWMSCIVRGVKQVICRS